MSRPKTDDAVFKSEIDDLVQKLTTSPRLWSLRRARRHFERSYAEYVIRRSQHDRHRAAERLNIGFSTLKEKIRKIK